MANSHSRQKSKAEKAGDAQKKLDQNGRVGVPDAAALLGMHHITLREYVQKGWVRSIMIGNRAHITREEITRYRINGKYLDQGQGGGD